MVTLRTLAYSTQQAADPHWHNHIKNPPYWLNASVNDGNHRGNQVPPKSSYLWVFLVLTAVSLSACWLLLLVLSGFYISPHVSPQEKLCNRHLVATSLAIVLRTLTNNYFLLFCTDGRIHSTSLYCYWSNSDPWMHSASVVTFFVFSIHLLLDL